MIFNPLSTDLGNYLETARRKLDRGKHRRVKGQGLQKQKTRVSERVNGVLTFDITVTELQTLSL